MFRHVLTGIRRQRCTMYMYFTRRGILPALLHPSPLCAPFALPPCDEMRLAGKTG